MKNSYEDLVMMKQEGKITWVEFVTSSELSQDYQQWCKDHAVEPSEENAELFLEMTDISLMDGQENLET